MSGWSRCGNAWDGYRARRFTPALGKGMGVCVFAEGCFRWVQSLGRSA